MICKYRNDGFQSLIISLLPLTLPNISTVKPPLTDTSVKGTPLLEGHISKSQHFQIFYYTFLPLYYGPSLLWTRTHTFLFERTSVI
jgi:hypothetical protein